MKSVQIFAACAAAMIHGAAAAASDAYAPAGYRDRLHQDEIIYFVLPDRFENGDLSNDAGGLAGDRLATGLDRTHKGFFHGGDLKGLTQRLDYIKGLGATAIWLGPIYKNKPVQGPPGQESAGYHGYWITDFTDVDPHFGSKADLKEFVAAAHEHGIKVYLDIITNHSADVIALGECHVDDARSANPGHGPCPYRSKADYPYATRGGPLGAAINSGFMGDAPEFQTGDNFEKLTGPDYAYAPFVPDSEKSIKIPAWMNDTIFYHNRGNSTFEGESSTYGDFAGLDDFMTENPRVVEGFISVYKDWISEFQIDGFRVDTAKHVNPAFWQAFIPAITEHARSKGIQNFYVFAEAAYFDVASLAAFMRETDFDAGLDFPMFSGIRNLLIKKGSGHDLAALLAADGAYENGASTAMVQPVFVGNHDAGRFGGELQRERPDLDADAQLKIARLAYAFLFFSRGAPVIYYGDEQGFTGDGGDQDAREDMFPSIVDSYNDNVLIGTKATTAVSNFNDRHPLYREIALMAAAYRAHDALRRGALMVRHSEKEGQGLFALSRIDEATGDEFLFVANTGPTARTANIEVDRRSSRWKPVLGRCAGKVAAPSSYQVSIQAYEFALCRSHREKQ